MTRPFHIIIPARYQSARLPGKPLLDIGGKPMIQRVVERCEQSRAESIVVATDDERIFAAVEGFGGRAVLTSGRHLCGSDRVAEAAEKSNLHGDDLVVNVQGDEPGMPAALIDQVAQALDDDDQAVMATASAPLAGEDEISDPSVVKVVTNQSGHAIYFSRAPIPWVRTDTGAAPAAGAIKYMRRHLGIYAYRADYIQKFAARGSCQLEALERLEQLRAVWCGEKIRCVDAVETPGPGIDTEEDLLKAGSAYIRAD